MLGFPEFGKVPFLLAFWAPRDPGLFPLVYLLLLVQGKIRMELQQEALN